MAREYVQVVPSTATYDPETVPEVLRGLQHLSTPSDGEGLLGRLIDGDDTPTFEFLILSTGESSPVEFFYGVDEKQLETLKTQLRNLYPDSFEITTSEINPARRITPQVAYDQDSFEEAVAADDLWTDIDPDDVPRTVETESPSPVRTGDGTIHARPAPDQVTPVGLRWHGVGTHKRDWMCRLRPYPALMDQDDEHGQPPLAVLIDQLGQADVPLAFQVVFQARPSWGGDQELRAGDIERGADTRVGRVGNALTEMISGEPPEQRDREELSAAARRRLEEMEAGAPETSFNATIRALTLGLDPDDLRGTPVTDATVQTTEGSDTPDRPHALTQLRGLLGPLSGEFYELDPTPFREEGWRQSKKEQNAQAAFERFRDRDVYVSESGCSRPHVVAAPDTLAGLVTVPSANALSVPARRDTRATDTVETPLPRPNPDRLDPYSEGMAIGQPLDAHREPQAEALRIPPAALTRHYARYGPTGSGKSTAIQNDLLSLHATTRGPSVLVDRKGDGMVENYLRAHYARFGDLEDVYYLSMPEALPAVPFFDVRPGLAAGRDRETVVQEKVEHFRELLRLVMGEDLFEQAFVANEILAFLIKALFDERYQHDAFGLEELTEAALTMQRDQTLPATSTKLDDVEASLARQFEKDPGQFIQSTDAVLNRLDSLRENTHLADVLRTTPDWDPNSEAYGDGTFDFRRIIDEDCVVLLDMGDLRAESSRALTLILLSNLWDALQYRQQAADNADTNASDDRLVNLIIEEAAPLVASSLVHEDLLPKGRSFGLGLGLVMQFPEQVQSVAADRGVGRRAYRELLNNVHTQILGGITLTDDFADSLVAEDLSVRQLKQRCNQLPAGEWIVDLPQLPFLEPPARPLSVRSLPIPEGHPESDTPLSDRAETVFREELTTVEHRSRASFAIDAGSTPIGSGPLGSASASDPSSGGTSADWGASSGVQPQTVSESPGQSTPAGAPLPSTTDDGSGGDEESWASPEDDPPAEVVLKRVLAAMNRDLDGYSLLDSMTEIVDVDGVDVDDLVDDGYLEKHSVCRRRYYSITEQGQRCIPGHLETGEGIGDLGEKTPHKVGVEALRAWLAAKPTVDEVRIYHEHGGVVYDVAAFAGDSLAWVGEVETDTNDYESIADDYQKLAAVDAEAVWAVPKKSVATETVLPALAAADAIPTAPTGQPARTMSELRETVADWDCDGIGSIWGFTGLTEEVDHS